jgi:pyruvate formate lyase activating enzyme
MIPTLNDDPAETRKLAEWILTHLGPDVPLHFTAFHPDFKLQDKPRTPAATLDRARQIALDAGLHYVYEGNIYSDGANTYCPQCRELLVRRSWHDVLENRIKKGSCGNCGFAIAGVWANDDRKKRGITRGASTAMPNYGPLHF